MEGSWFGVVLLGLLVTIHPCPLTTNIAVIGMLCGWRQSVRGTLAVGFAFVAGYVLTYMLLAALVVGLALSHSGVARALQEWVSPLLGPLLIIVGMLQCGLLKLPGGKPGDSNLAERLRSRDWGVLGALPIGMALALAFCPATATIFVTQLLTQVGSGSVVLQAALFALGASLPLVVIVVAIAKGVAVADRGQGFWRRRLPLITGVGLILVGCWLTLRHLVW